MNRLRFDEFVLDPARRQLRRGETVLPLSGKAFDLLLHMATHPGQPLAKEDLLNAVWHQSIVEESNLTYTIHQVRKVLSQSGSAPVDLIKTLSGVGYQFTCTVVSESCESDEHPALYFQPRLTAEPRQEEDRPPPPASQALQPTSFLPSQAPPATARRRGRHLALWSLAALALLCLLLFFPAAPKSRSEVVNAVCLTHDGRAKLFLGSCGLAFDGKQLIFTETQNGRNQIAEVSIEGGPVRTISAPMGDSTVADFSTVNHLLLMGATWRANDERPILTQTTNGAGTVQVGELTGHDASWSPDAKSIAVARGRFLYLANADGSNVRRIVSGNGEIYFPKWSPDGHSLRFSQNLGGNQDQLWEVAQNGENLHQLFAGTADADRVCCGTWSGDGRKFAFIVQGIVSNSLWITDTRETLALLHLSRPTQLKSGHVDFWQAPLLNQDATTLWAAGLQRRGEVVVIDPASRQPKPFLGGINAEGVTFSPDRQWIAYTEYPGGNLWRSRPDGTEKRQLVQTPMVARYPQWSPDGRSIAFMASSPGSTWRIYLISSSGGKYSPLLDDPSSQGVPGWSPDAKQIVFGRLTDYGNEVNPDMMVEIVDVESHLHRTLHGSKGMWTPRWSPDGRYISTVSQDNKLLWLYDMQTMRWSNLAHSGVNDVIWSPDSQYIYFDTYDPHGSILYRISIATRKLERWADLGSFPRGGFYQPWLGMSPEGAPILIRDTSIQEIYRLELTPDDY